MSLAPNQQGDALSGTAASKSNEKRASARPRISVILVTWNERELVRACVPPLLAQLHPDDELIVADNASSDGTPEAVRDVAPDALLLEMPCNDGYMPACNLAAARATGEILLLIDADAVVAEGFCDAICAPLCEQRGWDAWMGLLTMDSGRLVNTSGGVVHFTGISWAGQVGEPVSDAAVVPHEVAFLTGACMAITSETWRRHPGFPEHFFLYFDDVDYSLRIRLAGGRIGIQPDARADHLYDFTKRNVKWRLLERNRWATIVRTYPTELLILLAPALLLTECALAAVAMKGGWTKHKVLAWGDTIRGLPRLLQERRDIQRHRVISAEEFALHLSSELSSPYLGAAGRSPLLRRALALYWDSVQAVLRLWRRSG